MNHLAAFIGVSKKYNREDVLKDLSFSISSGEIIGVLGASGAGKSTMMKLLSGIEHPTSGAVINRAVRTGYVFQEPRLLPWKTALENVMLPLTAVKTEQGRAKKAAMQQLERMGLKEYADYYPKQLSGGMIQRVSLARAFVNEPQLLLMDEPFSAIDLKLKELLMFLLKEHLKNSPAAVVYISHAPDEILRIAHRVFIFEKGGGFHDMPCSRENLMQYYDSADIAGFLRQIKIKEEKIMSDWLKKRENFTTMDMRTKTMEFLPELLKIAEGIKEGDGLHVIQSFEPVPLYFHMEKSGFVRHTEKYSDSEYHAYFYKTPPETPSMASKMAQHLNVSDIRAEKIASIVMDFFNGASLESLKPDYNGIAPVTSAEFAYAEQLISDRGVPDSRFENNINSLIKLFKSSLDIGAAGSYPDGHPITTYKKENREIEKIAEAIRHEIRNSGTPDIEYLKSCFLKLKDVGHHYVRKENQLFPFLEKKGFDKPSTVMWSLHDKIRNGIKECIALLDGRNLEGFLSIQDDVLEELLGMIYKEEKILLPTAEMMLTEDEWKQIRSGERELSYCFIDTPPMWGENTAPKTAVYQPRTEGIYLKLSEGMLSYEQINAIFSNLPIDVSFVDADDRVRFYNQSAERIFPRSPEVIGREVRYCHPPKSVDTVMAILSAFKSGEKNVAEFWLELHGKFLHIRYFAVRDAAGAYMGTLEVMQNVTEIRKLEGARTLLSWE